MKISCVFLCALLALAAVHGRTLRQASSGDASAGSTSDTSGSGSTNDTSGTGSTSDDSGTGSTSDTSGTGSTSDTSGTGTTSDTSGTGSTSDGSGTGSSSSSGSGSSDHGATVAVPGLSSAAETAQDYATQLSNIFLVGGGLITDESRSSLASVKSFFSEMQEAGSGVSQSELDTISSSFPENLVQMQQLAENALVHLRNNPNSDRDRVDYITSALQYFLSHYNKQLPSLQEQVQESIEKASGNQEGHQSDTQEDHQSGTQEANQSATQDDHQQENQEGNQQETQEDNQSATQEDVQSETQEAVEAITKAIQSGADAAEGISQQIRQMGDRVAALGKSDVAQQLYAQADAAQQRAQQQREQAQTSAQQYVEKVLGDVRDQGAVREALAAAVDGVNARVNENISVAQQNLKVAQALLEHVIGQWSSASGGSGATSTSGGSSGGGSSNPGGSTGSTGSTGSGGTSSTGSTSSGGSSTGPVTFG